MATTASSCICRLAGVDKGDELLSGLEERGHPVIRIVAEDSYQLGQLFFLWEIAIAVAGSVIGINPFDQPDVESAKVKARELADAIRENRRAARRPRRSSRTTASRSTPTRPMPRRWAATTIWPAI